jgi:LemA protein
MTVLRRFGLLAPLAAFSLAGCGLNSVPTAEEQVNAAWGNLQSEYQRRSDLIPNLVSTVKGAANQEKSVLVEVTNARANANRIQLSPADLADPAKVRGFNDAQNQVTLSLQRLQEAYPELKSNENFLTLQSQIEGTENQRCRPITRVSAPSPTRSAPRSSTAPSPRSRSKPPPAPRTRPRSTSATQAEAGHHPSSRGA